MHLGYYSIRPGTLKRNNNKSRIPLIPLYNSIPIPGHDDLATKNDGLIILNRTVFPEFPKCTGL